MKKHLFPTLSVAAALGLFTGCTLFSPRPCPEIAALKLPTRITKESLTLSNGDRKFEIRPGTRIATFNGTTVYLLQEPKLTEENIFTVDPASVEKVIVPLMYRSGAPATPVKTILIDPGHGGRETGATGRNHQEKTLNLALAQQLRAELEKRGFKVLMTRDADSDLSLDARDDLTRTLKPDLFISVHHNAATNNTATGVETYALTPAGSPSTAGGSVPAGPLPGNKFDAANVNLAQLIQDKLNTASGGPDRGLKFARFRVLVRAECPAVLIEAGFISTPSEEDQIASRERQEKVAGALAEAVKTYSQRRLRE